jgi:hypothetical protein
MLWDSSGKCFLTDLLQLYVYIYIYIYIYAIYMYLYISFIHWMFIECLIVYCIIWIQSWEGKDLLSNERLNLQRSQITMRIIKLDDPQSWVTD